ncbi:hypothetical protein [Halobellus captivus]|uniref:hypothetical protein n=1 Tax=Halobellus captivus TaxID=2592614 RepID=UPI0011A561DC|nr:hypothetical protein [Halobellus captivus]
MSAIIEALRILGLRGSAIGAASLVLVAFYLWRAKRIGSRAATMSAAAIAYSVASLVVLALVLALGWADPNPGVAMEHVREGASVAIERGTEPARRVFRWVVEILF